MAVVPVPAVACAAGLALGVADRNPVTADLGRDVDLTRRERQRDIVGTANRRAIAERHRLTDARGCVDAAAPQSAIAVSAVAVAAWSVVVATGCEQEQDCEQVPHRSIVPRAANKLPVARRTRVQVGVLLFQLVGVNLLAATPAPPARPITEADVYREMGELMELLGHQESVLVSAGTGYVGDGIGTLDIGYRHRGFRGAWELLPTTIGVSLWGGANPSVNASLGYMLVLGLYDGPYVTANALGQWSPGSTGLGFDTGIGREWRQSDRWSLTADLRVVKLWSVTGDESPWGGRVTVGVRRYLGL